MELLREECGMYTGGNYGRIIKMRKGQVRRREHPRRTPNFPSSIVPLGTHLGVAQGNK